MGGGAGGPEGWLNGRKCVEDCSLMHAVAEHVVDWAVRPIDGQLSEIGPAEAGDLGVEIGEQPGLQKGVVGGFDAGDEVAGVEGDLFGFGKVVGGVAVQRQLANQLHGSEFFRDQFGRVE